MGYPIPSQNKVASRPADLAQVQTHLLPQMPPPSAGFLLFGLGWACSPHELYVFSLDVEPS